MIKIPRVMHLFALIALVAIPAGGSAQAGAFPVGLNPGPMGRGEAAALDNPEINAIVAFLKTLTDADLVTAARP